MSTFLKDHRSCLFLRWNAPIWLMLVALTTVANAQVSDMTSLFLATAMNATANVWAERSSIVVRIDPRLPSGGSGFGYC